MRIIFLGSEQKCYTKAYGHPQIGPAILKTDGSWHQTLTRNTFFPARRSHELVLQMGNPQRPCVDSDLQRCHTCMLLGINVLRWDQRLFKNSFLKQSACVKLLLGLFKHSWLLPNQLRFTYVCMHVCVYVCICMYMYVYVCICMYVCMYVRMYVCMYTYVYTYTYTYVCIYTCLYMNADL